MKYSQTCTYSKQIQTDFCCTLYCERGLCRDWHPCQPSLGTQPLPNGQPVVLFVSIHDVPVNSYKITYSCLFSISIYSGYKIFSIDMIIKYFRNDPSLSIDEPEFKHFAPFESSIDPRDYCLFFQPLHMDYCLDLRVNAAVQRTNANAKQKKIGRGRA